MKKEESVLFRIERLLDEKQKRSMEESKLPVGIINLAQSASENEQTDKREEEMEQRLARLKEVEQMFSVTRPEIFNSFQNGFYQAT